MKISPSNNETAQAASTAQAAGTKPSRPVPTVILSPGAIDKAAILARIYAYILSDWWGYRNDKTN